MKIVVTLKNIEEIPELIHLGADVFLLESNTYTRAAKYPFSLEEIIDIAKTIHKKKKKTYILLNTFIHEQDIEGIRSFLSALDKSKVEAFVCYDFSLIIIAKELNMEQKIIYQPGTMNTHPKDMAIFKDLGIKGITISREITFAEICEFFQENEKLELSLSGHGYQEMFYSKRKLLESFMLSQKKHEFGVIPDAFFQIREKMRPDSYFPIFEDGFGTQIYRGKKLASFDFIEWMEPYIQDFFIERRFISDQEYYASIKAYALKDYVPFTKEYGSEYDTGFFMQKTEKIKGDL